MNAGAARASAEVLRVLHAGARLPPGFDTAVPAALADRAVVGGRALGGLTTRRRAPCDGDCRTENEERTCSSPIYVNQG